LQNNILSFFKNKGTFYLIGLIFITTCISCQKEIVPQNKNIKIPKVGIENTKMLYDMVKAYNTHNIIKRDDISYSFPEALGEIQTLFSYTYGDYHKFVENSFNLIDTVNFSLSGSNINGAQFCALTNEVLNICAAQRNSLSTNDTIYFFSVTFNILNQTNSSATVEVSTVLGTGSSNVSVNSGQTWPYRGNLGGFCKEKEDCGFNISNEKQAPYKIQLAVNYARPYVNPIIAISQGQEVVVINANTYKGTSYYAILNKNIPENENNRWMQLMNASNPIDSAAGDCMADFNCWRWKGPSDIYQDNSDSCYLSAPRKCIINSEAEHYYNRFLYSVLDCFQYYDCNYLINYTQEPFGGGVCIGNFCRYWWNNSIIIGKMIIVPTKPGDKKTFPSIIQ
jgi:hypothetical protein